jgi:two-component sensor histidine kinase
MVMANLPLRVRLPLLVAGTMLPLIVFAADVVYYNHVRERETAFDHVLEVTRGLRIVLDEEMQGLTLALDVLAGSQALQHDDLDGFRRNVDQFLRRFPAGTAAIALFDRDGRQVLNSSFAADEPLPVRVNQEMIEHVFRTGQPFYSNLFVGSVRPRRIITVSIPVLRGSEIVYELSFNPPFDTFQEIIERQRPGPDWTMSIFDRNGINFARVPNPETTIGERASPTLFAEMFKSPEAKLSTVSLEGVPLLTAYSRAAQSGWTVAAGIAADTVIAPLWRSLAITTGIGLALLAVGLAFALGMARQIARGEALHRLLVSELNHRVKNTLATVQSIAAQTFRERDEDPAEARRKFDARLAALGRAHDVLSNERWETAELREVVDGVLQPYAATNRRRLHLSGPEIRVAPRTALMISMTLHELATNAAKYGALSNATGEIFIDWARDNARDLEALRIIWRERGGPAVQLSDRKGFGSRLIQEGFARQLGGSATLDYDPAGLTCTLTCPVE